MSDYNKAKQMIRDLCEGKRQWIMSIPADTENDPDLVISDALTNLQKELQELKAAVRWLNSYAYIEGDLDSHCQGVIDEAEESSSDADKAHAETLRKVLDD